MTKDALTASFESTYPWLRKAGSPIVRASRSTTLTIPNTTPTTIVYNTEAYDNSNAYDPTTGTFTAPLTGHYGFSAAVQLSTACTYLRLHVLVNGSIVQLYGAIAKSATDVQDSTVLNGLVYLSQGQTAVVQLAQTNTGAASRTLLTGFDSVNYLHIAYFGN